MKKIKVSIFTAILSSLLFTSLSFSQNTSIPNTKLETSNNTKSSDAQTEATTVATVNIYNATSTEISTSTFSFSFQIFNRVGVQSNIRYGLELVNVKTNEAVDRKLSNEALTLGAGDSKDIKMSYSIPGFISNGEYRLFIVSQNQNGLSLAYAPVGFPEKTISINTNYPNGILSLENCFIFINNDQKTKYNLSQGVNIKTDENLSVNCDVKNNTNNDLNNLKIQMITHKRNQFGDVLGNNFLDKSFSLNKNSSQNISFNIPVVSGAQAYDVDTFLVNSKNQKVSRSIFAHYVIHGASATIQNAYLDKENYKKGETANVKIFWSPSADSFTDSRFDATNVNYNLSVNIRDQNKNLCGATSSATSSAKISNSLVNQNIKVSIAKDCPNPVATISILNKETSEILDTTQINLKNQTETVNIDPGVKNISSDEVKKEIKNDINYQYIMIAAIILCLIIMGYGIIKLKGEHVIQPASNNE